MAFDNINKNTPWTDERVELLKQLWAEGLSCTLIADQLGGGLSRDAVIGKVHRLGCEKRTTPPIARRIASGLAQPRAKRQHNNLAGVNAVRRTYAPRAPQPLPEPVLVDVAAAKPWLERQFGECAYIVSGEGADAISCCNPCDKRGYCPGHRAIMFTPALEPLRKNSTVSFRFGRRAA